MIKKLKQNKLLVIEIYYFKVLVSIAVKKGKEIQTLESVKRNSIFPLEALVQCLEELRSKCKGLPKNAICLTTDAVAGVVNLKDEGEETHTSLQVQWEMENSVLPSIPAISVEQLLKFEGFLKPGQFENLMLFEEEQSLIADDFVERLLRAEIIDEDRVEEIQYFIDERPQFNDFDNFDSFLLQQDKVKGKNFAATVSASNCKQDMLFLLKSHKINLLATVPWSLSSINEELIVENQNSLYIEEHPSFWITFQIKKKRLVEMQIVQSEDKALPVEILGLMEDDQFLRCQLVSNQHKFANISDSLHRETELLEIKTHGNALIKTAGNIAWKLTSEYQPATAEVVLPPVPLKQKPAFWWSIAVAVCMFYNLAFFYSLYEKKEKAVNEVKSKTASKKKATEKLAQANFDKKQSAKLNKELKDLLIENERLKKLSLGKRPGNFVKKTIEAISRVNLQGLKIDTVEAAYDDKYLISGLALSQHLPYELSAALAENVEYSSPMVTVEAKRSHFSFEITLNKKP